MYFRQERKNDDILILKHGSYVLYKSQIEQFFWPSDKNRKQAKNFSNSRHKASFFFMCKTVLEYNQVVFLRFFRTEIASKAWSLEGIYLPFLSPFLFMVNVSSFFLCVTHFDLLWPTKKHQIRVVAVWAIWHTRHNSVSLKMYQKYCNSYFASTNPTFFSRKDSCGL